MQKRSNSGTDFENLISEQYGKRVSKSPKMVWNGVGRTNLDKIKNLNYDEKLFYPTDKTDYTKYDLIDSENNHHEIKKYHIRQVQDWRLYSEPVVKISTKPTLVQITNKFGDGDEESARTKYNDFMNRLFNHLNSTGILETMKNKITNNIKGMFLIDGYLKITEIDFRWKIIESSWKGFNRITLEFKNK